MPKKRKQLPSQSKPTNVTEPKSENMEQERKEQERKRLETAQASNVEATAESSNVEAQGVEEGDKNEDEEEDLEEETVDEILAPLKKEQLVYIAKQAVETYPDFLVKIRKLAEADPFRREIYVYSIGLATDELLSSVFGKYGEIEECDVIKDKYGISRGFAFILFRHRSGARKAVKQRTKNVGNETSHCRLAHEEAAPPVSLSVQKAILVGNVTADLFPHKVCEFFEQFGEIQSVQKSGNRRGFIRIVFRSFEGARKALEDPYRNIDGHILYCKKADAPKGNKGYDQHHDHHQSHYFPREEDNIYFSDGPEFLMAPPAPGTDPALSFHPGVPPLGQPWTDMSTAQGYGYQGGVSYWNQPLMQQYQIPPWEQSSSSIRPQPGAGPSHRDHEMPP